MAGVIVQSLWVNNQGVSSKYLSTMELLSINSFLAHGHEYHLYIYDDILNIPDGVIIKDGNEILPADQIFYYTKHADKAEYKTAGSVSAFSNLFRYKLLYDRGNYWVDTDMICLRPFDFDSEYVFSSEAGGKVNGGVIKAPVGSKFARYLYQVCSKVDRETVKWGQIGPQLVGKGVRKFGLEEFVLGDKAFCPLHYTEFDLLFEEGGFDLGDSYCIHLWNEWWKRKGVDKDGEFKEGCLYESLKRMYLQVECR